MLSRLDGEFSLVRFPSRLVGAQCYAISPGGAQRLLARCHPLVEPVDEYMDRFWVHGVEIVGLLPYVATHREQDTNSSTIGDDRAPRKLTGLAKVRRETFRFVDALRRESVNTVAGFGTTPSPNDRISLFHQSLDFGNSVVLVADCWGVAVGTTDESVVAHAVCSRWFESHRRN